MNAKGGNTPLFKAAHSLFITEITPVDVLGSIHTTAVANSLLALWPGLNFTL